LGHGRRDDDLSSSADIRFDPEPVHTEHDGQLLDDRVVQLAARQRAAEIRNEHQNTLLPGDVAVVF